MTWKHSGGINRTSDVATSAAFRAEISGSIAALMGDPSIPVYHTPDRYTEIARLHEGSIYHYLNSTTTIGKYLDGTSFAQQYAMSFGSWCHDVKIVNVQALPEAAAHLNALYARLNAQFDYGEANFTCTANGTSMRGYVFAGTGRRDAVFSLWCASRWWHI